MPPDPPPAKPRGELLAVRCHFLDLLDDAGRVIFSSCLPALDVERQRDWIAREQAAGGTHYVVSIETGYPGYWVPIVNFWTSGRMVEWVASVERIVAAGLTPIVFLDDGARYPGDAYFRDLCAWLVAHAPALRLRSIWVPAWEPRRDGDWTAAEFDGAVRIMREVLGSDALIGYHGSGGTHTFGDGHGRNPSDPWNGLSEPDEWRVHAGAEIDVLLFQTVSSEDPRVDEWGQPLWWDRALDVAERFLPAGTSMPFAVGKAMRDREGRETTRDGYAGGPKGADWFGGGGRPRGRPTLVAFEYVGPAMMHGGLPESRIVEVADTLYQMGFRHFGNGLPTALRETR